MSRPFTPPSAPTLVAAALVALAVGFVRCRAPQPDPAALRSPDEGTGTARSEATRPSTRAEASASADALAPGTSSLPSPQGGVPDAQPSAVPSPKRRCVVAAIGDSLTDARSGGGKYLSYLEKRCPESRFDNYGVGGNMVNQMRKRFERDLPSAPSAYTHLIVFGGVNDLYSDLTAGRTPEKIEKDLDAMYSAAKSRGWSVVAITVAPWGGFAKYYNASRAATTRELNSWISAQQSRNVDHVVDAFGLLSCGDAETLCPEYAKPFRDGLHFGPLGHEKLGEKLYEAVFSSCR